MTTIKILQLDYYCQTNNEIAPGISCNFTTAIECLDALKYDLKKIPGYVKQPEDRIRVFSETDEDIKKFFELSHPGSKLPPAEWLDMQIFTINKIFPQACTAEMNWTREKIVKEIDENRPLTMSTTLYGGHYLVVKGYNYENYIVDDPYNKGNKFNVFKGRETDGSEFKWYGVRFLKNGSI
jgi:hypothetical protein